MALSHHKISSSAYSTALSINNTDEVAPKETEILSAVTNNVHVSFSPCQHPLTYSQVSAQISPLAESHPSLPQCPLISPSVVNVFPGISHPTCLSYNLTLALLLLSGKGTSCPSLWKRTYLCYYLNQQSRG